MRVPIVCLVMTTFALTFPVAQGQARVTDAAFISGCWSFERNGRVVEEHWLAPAGGTLLGVSRTVAAGKTEEFEFLQVREAADGLSYVAKPSGQAEATFKLTAKTANSIVFENPAHDFPQRISYRRDGDTLTARIEGTLNGKARALDFPYRRAHCSD